MPLTPLSLWDGWPYRTLRIMQGDERIDGAKRLEGFVDEYVSLIRSHGQLSAADVIRREELVRAISEYTGFVSRKRMLKRAREILQNPALYSAAERRRKFRRLQYRRLSMASDEITVRSGHRARRHEFDADRVRQIVPSATETSRRKH